MKKLLCLILAVIMMVSIAGCANPAPAAQQDAEAAEKTEEQAEAADDHAETVELSFVLLTSGSSYKNDALMEENLAKIAKDKLNVDLKIRHVNFGDMATNLNLWLSSGESCDIFNAMDFPGFIEQGFLTDLTPYEEELKETIELVGEYGAAGIVDGKRYGIPAMKDMINYSCYVMRKDYIDEVGVDYTTVTDYDALADLCRKILEKHPDVHPICNGSEFYGTLFTHNLNRVNGELVMTDLLIRNPSIGLMDPANSSEVGCLFFTDYYEEMVNRASEWKQEGLIYTSELSVASEQVRAGTAAGYGTQYKPGVEVQEGTNAQTEMVVICCPKAENSVRSSASLMNWCIGANCPDKKRAAELMNLFYTDKDMANLLAWGTEGEDYVLTDDPRVIEFPEGMDASSASYFNDCKWALPNNYLQYVMAPNPADLWDQMINFDKSAKTSKAFGFLYAPSSDDINGKITDINNIVNQYTMGLTSGTIDPSKLENFRNELKAAGIDDVIADVQTQLDAFLAQN